MARYSERTELHTRQNFALPACTKHAVTHTIAYLGLISVIYIEFTAFFYPEPLLCQAQYGKKSRTLKSSDKRISEM